MAKRFKNLDSALKYLSPRGSDGESTSDAPVGSQLRYYQDWKSGKRAIEYGDRDTNSLPKNLLRVAVKPFAFGSADAKEYIVDLSQRAFEKRGDAGITVEILGANANVEGATTVVNFKPAKAIVNVPTSSKTPAESKLTGRKYKKRGSSSYTFPFGRTTANNNYSEQKGAILDTIGSSTRIISFQPEIFK